MLVELVKKNRNIELRINPGELEMMRLIRNAHVNLLPTFQNTGTKLKLLNALFNGRFVLVNSPMVENTGLGDLCIVREKSEEMKQAVVELMEQSFEASDIQKRKVVLGKSYSNAANAAQLIDILYTVSQ